METGDDGRDWIEVRHKPRKSNAGIVLQAMGGKAVLSKPSPSPVPTLESLKSRLKELDRRMEDDDIPSLEEGPLSDLHLTVSQLIWVKSDTKTAAPLLDELETGLLKTRSTRRQQRRDKIAEQLDLASTDYVLALKVSQFFLDDVRPLVADMGQAATDLEGDLDPEAYRSGVQKLLAAVANLKIQAEKSSADWIKKNDNQLQLVLGKEEVQTPLRALHQGLIAANGEFDSSMQKGDVVLAAGKCRVLDLLLRSFVARDQFEAMPFPLGEGIWKFNATRIYKPPHPMEVPGTDFNEVCPGQSHVNRQIVEAKLAGKLPATPLVPAVITAEGKIVLQDKHHTFVACMALGRPVKLALISNPPVDAKSDWGGCTWKGFEKPGLPGKGFSVPKDESEQLQGASEPVADWEKQVPWRKDTPPDDEGKVMKMVAGFKALVDNEAVAQQLVAACKDDEGLATRLFEVLQIGAVTVKTRPVREGSTGGDWNAAENTIELDENLAPLDLVDMLVWEAHNAMHAMDFAKVQHDAHAERMTPDVVGDKKAKIEAKTEIEYLEHLLARAAKNSKVSANGQTHIDAIDKKFIELNLEPYSSMNDEERKSHHSQIEAIFLATPHDQGKAIPARGALKSGELYAYEHIADTQNVKGIIAFLRDLIPEGHPKKLAFLNALRAVKDSRPPLPNKPPMSWAGKFYEIVSEAGNRIFDLKLAPFSSDQQKVAAFEASAETWSGALIKAIDQIALAEVEQEVVTEPVEESVSPGNKLYFENRSHLDQATVATVRTTELAFWAEAHGVSETEALDVRKAMADALIKYPRNFKNNPPLESEYDEANEVLQEAIAELERFDKKTREVIPKSEAEAEFRKHQHLLDHAAVLQVKGEDVKRWAATHNLDFSKVTTIRRVLDRAMIESHKALKADGMPPSEHAFAKARDFLSKAVGQLEVFAKG